MIIMINGRLVGAACLPACLHFSPHSDPHRQAGTYMFMHNEIIALFHTNQLLRRRDARQTTAMAESRIYHHNQPTSQLVTNERPSVLPACQPSHRATTAKTSARSSSPCTEDDSTNETFVRWLLFEFGENTLYSTGYVMK